MHVLLFEVLAHAFFSWHENPPDYNQATEACNAGSTQVDHSKASLCRNFYFVIAVLIQPKNTPDIEPPPLLAVVHSG